ncbi:hypothetical protein [Nonomuraea basaltis]|uniref:hypothetical protein n=1 Tax=Nonomuraea basaltis TaxID=2495887 RepID=UPI00110C600D|nr:hypothetical protein [Nonomuraea basaltis]TMS00117.1 hypothetical protein EJK15_03335 [Nonomuraea basaltis]
MAQSRPWLTLADASSVLGIPEFQVLDLAVSGRLHSRLKHDHREVCAADVIEFDVEMHTSRAVHADKPTWEPWTAAEDPGAFAERADHDTPNDEGAEQQ